MNKADTAKVMAVIRAVYPKFYSDADMDAATNAWTMMFDQEDREQVMAAVKAFIATDTKGFPPAIGQIKEQLARLRAGENGELTEQEAWALVQKALRNGIYGYQKEFAALPTVVQRCIGSPIMLHEWAQMDIETTNSVVSSNFMRSYRARAGHVREMEKLPEDVRKLYAAVGDAFRLPEAAPPKPESPKLEPGEPIPVPAHFLEKRAKFEAEAEKERAKQAQARVRQIFGNLIGQEAADRYFRSKEAAEP